MIDKKDRRGKIRNYFLTLEKNPKNLEKLESIEENLDFEMKYIQMVLPLNKITKEVETVLKENVERNIIQAKIREVKENDLENLITLYNRAWLTSHEPFRALTIDDVKDLYNDPDLIIFIARVYGIDAGFMILDFEGPKQEYGIIVAMGVIPRFQRKGLGKIMALTAWEFFKKKNIIELRSEVYIDNYASYNFLKSLGFEDRGIRIYKSEDFDFAITTT
ncbi:MAG: GNAT family N-acetyltransferase [Candidatus Hodarchaeota archaeon]